jgi:hypothetical protein
MDAAAAPPSAGERWQLEELSRLEEAIGGQTQASAGFHDGAKKAAAFAAAASAAAATAAAAAAVAAANKLRCGNGREEDKEHLEEDQRPHPTRAMAARKRLVAAELEAMRLAECTFAPDVSASQRTWSPAVQDHGDPSSSHYFYYLERNRARAVEDAARRKAEELLECSFAPRLSSSSSSSFSGGGGNVALASPRHLLPRPPPRVRGLERFLATRRRAVELRQEAEARQAKVAAGSVAPRATWGQQQQQWGAARFTVPEPLALETERRAALKVKPQQGGGGAVR